MGDPTAFVYVTPRQLMERLEKMGAAGEENFEELRAKANAPDRKCEVCGQLPAWKFGGLGMCFPCTTGETDASNDFELLPDQATPMDAFASVPARVKVICPDCHCRVKACGYWQHRRDKHGDSV